MLDVIIVPQQPFRDKVVSSDELKGYQPYRFKDDDILSVSEEENNAQDKVFVRPYLHNMFCCDY